MPTLSPVNVLIALSSLEHEWPVLVGAGWPNIEAQYRDLRARLESTTGSAQMLVAADLVQLLSPFVAARERLNTAIAATTEEGSILVRLAVLADQLGLDPSVGSKFRQAAQLENSQRFIWQSSSTKATSLKLENVRLSFELGAFTEFLIGVITTTTNDVLGEANLILKAMGVLLVLTSLYKATAIKLDEREATVFCGFAKAPTRKDGGVKENVILKHANAVRREVSLKPLDRQELGNALHKLAEIKSIERVSDQPLIWRIVEKYDLHSIRGHK